MFPATTANDVLKLVGSSHRATKTTVIAMFSAGLGTVVAVLLVPRDPSSEGALFASAIAMSAGLSLVPVVALFRRPKMVLRGEYILSLAPIYWLMLDLLQGVYSMETIDRAAIIRAFVGIGLFVVMVWIGSAGRPWQIPAVVINAASEEFSLNAYFALAIVSFAIGMLNFAIPCNFNVAEMLYYLGQERWSAPWGRGQLGGWDAFLDHLQYFGYLLPVLTVVVSRHAGWRNARTLLCTGMSVVMTLFLAQSGSRRVIGVVVGIALVLWVLDQHRLQIKQLLQTLAAIGALLFALQLMLEYRNVGLGALVGFPNQEFAEKIENRGFLQQEYLRVDDNFFRLCQIIELIPSSHPFVYHQYFVWVIVRPIPRVFWPEKPVDPGFDLPTALGVEGVSYSYSIVGELYMSMGFIGIAFGGWFYGRVSAMARGLLNRTHSLASLLMYSIVVMALFSGMRSILELVLVSYCVLAWIGLSRFMRTLRKFSR